MAEEKPEAPRTGMEQLIEAFGETPAPAGESAPAPSESVVTPPAPAPAAAAAQTEAGTPAAPPEPPVAQPVVDKADKFISTLLDQNKNYLEGIQKEREANRQMMEQLFKELRPEMTEAQRQEAMQSAFKALNTDPNGYISSVAAQEAKKVADQIREEFKADLEARTAPQQRQQAIASQLQNLHRDKTGKIIRPELSDEGFVKHLLSPDIQQKTLDQFYQGEDPSSLHNNPAFFRDLYYVAQKDWAAQAAQSAAQQQQAAGQEAQRKVLSTHGAAGGSGKATPQEDKGQSFVEQMRAFGGGDPFSGAKWSDRR